MEAENIPRSDVHVAADVEVLRAMIEAFDVVFGIAMVKLGNIVVEALTHV